MLASTGGCCVDSSGVAEAAAAGFTEMGSAGGEWEQGMRAATKRAPGSGATATLLSVEVEAAAAAAIAKVSRSLVISEVASASCACRCATCQAPPSFNILCYGCSSEHFESGKQSYCSSLALGKQ